MQRLSRTLYFKLSRTLLFLLLVLIAIQLSLLAAFWHVFLDETEQRLNWKLASRIAPQFQRLIDTRATYLDLLDHAREITHINPKLDVYVVDPTGNILADLSFSGAQKLNRINLLEIKAQLADRERPDFPLYINNPNDVSRGVVFSLADLTFAGSPAHLLVALDSWRNRGFYSFVGENKVGLVIFILSTVSLIITGVIGIFVFFILTKRFRTIAAQVERFRNKDFSTRLDIPSDDELGDLAGTVNAMADTIVSGFKELEQRDQLRRDLIANVSHDLRGPVAIISGYAEDLFRRADRITAPQLREFGETLLRSVGALQKLLLELFDLAKLETQEAQLELEAFSVDQMISGLVGSYASKAQHLELTLQDHCQDRLPLVVGDIAMIERVLTNLLENALRYTPAGGAVVLRASAQESGVLLEVFDTGLGIPEEDLPNIFDRFYRVASAKPRTGTSTGLGLAIVKKIIEAHSSEITVQSTVGQGTVFGFILPFSNTPKRD